MNEGPDLTPGEEFVVRTVSGSVYRVTAQAPSDGLQRVNVIQLEARSAESPTLQLDGAFIAVPYGIRPLAVGSPLDLVAIDETSGERLSFRTSLIEAVERVPPGGNHREPPTVSAPCQT
jgi:hypothetical protein